MLPLKVNIYTERLIVMLLIAVFLHTFGIFGIGYKFPKPIQPGNTTMRMILVQKKTEKAPEKPDYLAQVSNEGSGEGEKKPEPPATPTLAPFPDLKPHPVTLPPPKLVAVPKPPPIETKKVITKKIPDPQKQEGPTKEAIEEEIEGPPAEQGEAEITTEENHNDTPSAAVLVMKSRQIASTWAEIDELRNEIANRPRKRFLNPKTKEAYYVRYMNAWKRKVEAVGNKELKTKESDTLILDVAINSNGTIDSVKIIRPSKYEILNDIALRVVHLAAPYAPFTPEMLKEVDIVHITRTWRFTKERVNTF